MGFYEDIDPSYCCGRYASYWNAAGNYNDNRALGTRPILYSSHLTPRVSNRLDLSFTLPPADRFIANISRELINSIHIVLSNWIPIDSDNTARKHSTMYRILCHACLTLKNGIFFHNWKMWLILCPICQATVKLQHLNSIKFFLQQNMFDFISHLKGNFTKHCWILNLHAIRTKRLIWRRRNSKWTF